MIIIKRKTKSNSNSTYDLLKSKNMHHNLHQQFLRNFFSFIIVLHFADQQISSFACHRRLKKLIQRQNKKIRNHRLINECLYSTSHFNHFFADAMKHIAQIVQNLFDFILSNRKKNLIEIEYAQHFANFFKFRVNHNISLDILSKYIASTIIMNVYSSNMHSKLFIETIMNVA